MPGLSLPPGTAAPRSSSLARRWPTRLAPPCPGAANRRPFVPTQQKRGLPSRYSGAHV
jgi:hypothetical protein